MGTASAMAADLPVRAPIVKAPMAPVVQTWTGCYIGGNIGGAWSNSHYTVDNEVVVESFSFDPTSVIGGGQVGCNYQFNRSWVIGIEGTYSGTDLSQTDTSVLLPGRLRTLKIDQIATVAGRLGFAVDQYLLYAKGGVAFGDIDTFGIRPSTGVNIDIRSWETGVTAGAGIETKIWQHLVLGAEFDWYNFKFDRSGTATDGVVGRFTNTNADIFTLTGRVSWLFN